MLKVGIIGGSGFYDFKALTQYKAHRVSTVFGEPSDELTTGILEDVCIVYIPRHGKNHSINPTNVNYRANIVAMKNMGVRIILGITACGSLNESMAPGHLVVPNSFIDLTKTRHSSLHDSSASGYGSVSHIPMSPSFCEETRRIVLDSIVESDYRITVHSQATVVTIEGPRFSSKAESLLYKSWGGDIINMTTLPEVILAKEAGISYVSIAMVTDYDSWKENESVDVQRVLSVLKSNVKQLKDVLPFILKGLKSKDWTSVIAQNEKTATLSVIS